MPVAFTETVYRWCSRNLIWIRLSMNQMMQVHRILRPHRILLILLHIVIMVAMMMTMSMTKMDTMRMVMMKMGTMLTGNLCSSNLSGLVIQTQTEAGCAVEVMMFLLRIL